MSNFVAPAVHPKTGKLQPATFLDDHYGKHRYGIRFQDGSIYPAEEVEVPPRGPRNRVISAPNDETLCGCQAVPQVPCPTPDVCYGQARKRVISEGK
jgi:hypothetical protein